MQRLKIPNGYFHLWQTYLLTRGINIFEQDFLADEHLQLQYVLSQAIDTQSDYALFTQVIDKTIKHLNFPQLIFEMAELVRPEHFGVLGYMATRSNSVFESLQNIIRFSRLVIDGDEVVPMHMQQKDQLVYLIWPYHSDKYILINEFTNVLMIQLARKIMPEGQFPLLQVNFAHAPQIPIYHYQKFYGCELSFNNSEYSFVIRLDGLDLKIDQADPSLMQLLVKQAEEAIASKPKFENIIQQSHYLIADYLRQHEQAPKIEQIAEILNISVRTFQRQLSEINHSFKKILEMERMKRCEQLLQENRGLTEIAMCLGYSDQSALARAYKAYSGQTLLEKKKLLK